MAIFARIVFVVAIRMEDKTFSRTFLNSPLPPSQPLCCSVG